MAFLLPVSGGGNVGSRPRDGLIHVGNSHAWVVQSFSGGAAICSVGLCQTSTNEQRNGVQWLSKSSLERAQFIFAASMYFSSVVNQMFSASPARF